MPVAPLIVGILEVDFVPRYDVSRLDELPHNAMLGVQYAEVLHEFCLVLNAAP